MAKKQSITNIVQNTKIMDAVYSVGLDGKEDCCELFYSEGRDSVFNVFSGELENVNWSGIYQLNNLISPKEKLPSVRVDIADLKMHNISDADVVFEYLKRVKAELNPEAIVINISRAQEFMMSNQSFSGFLWEAKAKLFYERSKADVYAQRIAGHNALIQ